MELDIKITNKNCNVAVIGLGYVGLSLAVDVAKSGFSVIGIDEDRERIERLNSNGNYISSVNSDDLFSLIDTGSFMATEDYSKLKECDVQIICVPTPLSLNKQPDLSYIERAANNVLKYLHYGTLVILQSTTFPGTTCDVVKPILGQSGMCCGKEYFLAFSPERVDPGNTEFNSVNTPRVVGGVTTACADKAVLFYHESIHCQTYKVSSTQVAEMSKLLENTYRSVNIGLINEVAVLCHSMNIDVWEVIDAAKTKPFGFQPFYPGAGVGGHCIPLDPLYLAWKVREHDRRATIIETSGNVLDNMPKYVMCRVMETMNARNILVNGANILMIGVAYKANINDIRESPSLKLLDLLLKNGAKVEYFDPFVPEFVYKNIHYLSVELSDEILQKSNMVIVMTPHNNIDFMKIYLKASLVFDTCNVFKSKANNIIKL